jgi:hypothetical protein
MSSSAYCGRVFGELGSCNTTTERDLAASRQVKMTSQRGSTQQRYDLMYLF